MNQSLEAIQEAHPLPPLPKADLESWYGGQSDLYEERMWDDDSMRAYAESARAALIQSHLELQARLDEAVKDAWRPIESAPKDNTEKVNFILIGCWPGIPDLVIWRNERPEHHFAGVKRFAQPEGWFCVNGMRSRITDPTHWMPLPALPAMLPGAPS